ncbi:MAG: hypothetical protein K8T91_13585 [Planctomycetes bacterium]|nr:hypothetical protein [Planctomycetota bacterium]
MDVGMVEGMVEKNERFGGADRSAPQGRIMLAFATCACCLSALVLAFNLGRHWPLGTPTATDAGLPSLSEVRQRGAIPYSELTIDRGTEPDKTTPASAADAKSRR